LAERRSLWTGAVDPMTTGMAGQQSSRTEIIVRSIREFYDRGFAYIYPQDGAKLTKPASQSLPGLCQSRSDLFCPMIIGPHAVNQSPILWEPKQAWFRIPRLFLSSDGPNFDMPKTQFS